MEGPWRKHVRLGVIQFMMFPDAAGNPARTVEAVKQILLDDSFDVVVVTKLDQETIRTVRTMALEAHASVGISTAPVILGGKLNLANLDEEGREAAVAAVRPSLDDSYVLGARVVEVLDGARSYPGPQDERKAVDQLVKSLKELCQYAKDRAQGEPTWIGLETFDRAVDKRSLVGPSELAVEVAQRVRQEHENFGITVDMGHVPLIGESYRDSLAATADYLIHAHLGNCIRDDKGHAYYGDTHPALGLPGGVADVPELAEFLGALRDVGYFEKSLPSGKPWVTFEVKPQPGQAPELLMANCKRAFKEAWALL